MSHSTPEAEIVAGGLALRTVGIPAVELWPHILERPNLTLQFKEDNKAMTQVINNGHSVSMRHPGRTHRVDLRWLHERFQEPWGELTYIESKRQAAHIFTKASNNPDSWRRACALIYHVDPTTFWSSDQSDTLSLEPLELPPLEDLKVASAPTRDVENETFNILDQLLQNEWRNPYTQETSADYQDCVEPCSKDGSPALPQNALPPTSEN